MKHWIWIELIGFDNTLPDFGVKDYLARCGFQPEGISLLITWLEFPLAHRGMQQEYLLDPNECSYGAHPASPERKRQQWSNLQLAGLIQELHRHGLQVYLSFFNFYSYLNEEGERVFGSFCGSRPFLMESRRSGRPTYTIHMLKRLEDGSYFEDVFQEKTVEALVDYGFDGLQLADGISSGRIALQEGDFSDDMVDQFLAETGIALPPELAVKEDGDRELLLRRADYIWQKLRGHWIGFHRRRWEQFYNKFARRLQAAGKNAVFNSAWTRDPFEAIYRYGVDYRHIARLGFKGCMVEDVSPGLALLSEEDNKYLMTDRQRRQIHYDFLATLMQNRAAMPQLEILPLTNIHDTQEQWGVLEHMPTSMTRTVLCNTNTLFWNGRAFTPILNGGWHCLGDSISREQWSFIRRNWEIGDVKQEGTPMGATWVWSDQLIDRELEGFIEKRQAPGRCLLTRLLEAGAPLYSIVRIDGLENFTGDLIVPNPGLLPKTEQLTLARYTRGRVWLIGELGELEERFPITRVVEENNSFGGLCLARFGQSEAPLRRIENPAEYSFHPHRSMEPCEGVWTHPLTYPPFSDEFFRVAAQLLTEACDCPRIIRHRESCEIISLRLDKNRYRVYLGNNEYYYKLPQVEMGRPIKSIRCLTKYEGFRVATECSTFTCRIPGRGMDAFEIETADA